MNSRSTTLTVASLLGIVVALYALYVELHADDPGFEAFCDINEHASCSKVLTSDFSHILSFSGLVAKGSALDVPNALMGVGFYAAVLLHPYVPALATLAAATFSVGLSCYLAGVLYFVLHDFCVVCVMSYILNFLIFAVAARRATAAAPSAEKRAAGKGKRT